MVMGQIPPQAPNLRVLGVPPEADQVSMLRIQVSGVRCQGNKKKLNTETLVIVICDLEFLFLQCSDKIQNCGSGFPARLA
jgi:hypothetical protein